MNKLYTILAIIIPSSFFRLFKIDVVVTHNGRFHADEITAVAVWKTFVNNKVLLVRTFDEELFSLFKDKGFIFMDVAREYDPERLLFDHHHFDSEYSSAGMVLKKIIDSGIHISDELKELIHMVDMNDIGQRQSSRHEYSYILSLFNQRKDLKGALKFALDTITSLKIKEEFLNEVQIVVSQATPFDRFTQVLELDWACVETSEFLNGETHPEILASITEGIDSRSKKNVWNINVSNVSSTSYEAHGISFKSVPGIKMEFVHQAGFLAVANTRKDAIDFLIGNGYK